MYENYVGDGTGQILHVFLGKNPGEKYITFDRLFYGGFLPAINRYTYVEDNIHFKACSRYILTVSTENFIYCRISFRCYNAASFVQ